LEKPAARTQSPRPVPVRWDDSFELEHLFRGLSSLASKSPAFLKKPRTPDDYVRLFWLDIAFGFSAGDALRQRTLSPSPAVQVLTIATERYQDAIFLARMLGSDPLAAYGLLQWARFLALIFYLDAQGELAFPLPAGPAADVTESALSVIFPKARRILRRNDLRDPVVARCARRMFKLYQAFSTNTFVQLPFTKDVSPIPGDVIIRAARSAAQDTVQPGNPNRDRG
jgi:hypothetical protein